MRRKALFLLVLGAAAPVLASEAHGGGGESVLGVVLKVLNIAVFFGILVYLMARPLRGFFEKHTEGIQSALDGSRAKERQAVELEEQARRLAASVDAEIAVLRDRFKADRDRVKAELESGTDRALTRLRSDHARSLRQVEESFRKDLVARTLRSSQAEAMRSLQHDLTPAERSRFLETVTAEGEGA